MRESDGAPGITTGRNRGGARYPAPIALRPGYMKLSNAVKLAAGSLNAPQRRGVLTALKFSLGVAAEVPRSLPGPGKSPRLS